MRGIPDDTWKYIQNLAIKIKKLKPEIWLIFILVFALLLRLYFFIGMGPNDDLCYLNCAYEITQDEFIFPKWIFMPRLMMHYPIAISFTVFGVSDFSAGLYFLFCSVGSVFVAYGIGMTLFNKKVGLVSAFLMSFFPIEVIYGTTIIPDVPLAFFLGLSVLFFLMAEKKNKNIYYLLAGIAIGAAWLVKSLAVVILLFYLFYFIFDIFFDFKSQIRGEKRKKYYLVIISHFKSLISGRKSKETPSILEILWEWIIKNLKRSITFAGFGLVLLLEGVLYYNVHGEFLLRFQLETEHYITSLIGVTLDSEYYPNVLFAKNAPYFNFLGLFFILFCFSAFFLFFEKNRKYLILLIWTITIILWLQYGTMNPYNWVLMHRIYRFLTIISIPISLTIGYFIVESRINKKRVFNIINIVIVSVLIISSMISINNSHLLIEQSLTDFKESADYLRKYPGVDIYADEDTCGKLKFLLGYERNEDLKWLDNVKSIDEIKDAFVVVDSSRGYIELPELRAKLPYFIWDPPSNWIKVRVINESYLEIYGTYDTTIYYVLP